jgi:hypothetical protein
VKFPEDVVKDAKLLASVVEDAAEYEEPISKRRLSTAPENLIAEAPATPVTNS